MPPKSGHSRSSRASSSARIDMRSWYHRFAVEEFSAERDRFDVRIGKNRFHLGGITLDLDRTDLAGEHVMKGRIEFGAHTPWPSSMLSPGAMGPYSFLPFIECNH